ncbi:uncharacterized protein [Miscanthus floridulus]|uniref:uncharacterized protein isoform X2 n=1 Tax=Miscanthus floridulus TaxID=154761 RepID=UPI0034588061
MASSSWDRVGQAASVMQVTGVDAFGLVNMIVQAAHTARRNRDLCQQLAQHVLIVADLLRKLDIPALRQHLETRRPLELLDAALFRAYKLVRSCAQRQENTSQIYQMFTGAEVASKLRLAQEEIDRYINLIPMITLVAAVGARQATNEVHEDGSNDAAPTQSRLPENRLSLQHVTQSLTLEELQPQGSSIDMEARRNGREARRNAWQVVTQNVYNGMFHQMGRYLTYGGTHKSTGIGLFMTYATPCSTCKRNVVLLSSTGTLGLATLCLTRLSMRGWGTLGVHPSSATNSQEYWEPPGTSLLESTSTALGSSSFEIASGREDDGDSSFHLVRWVWELYGQGALLDAADPGLHGEFDADQMERALIVGLWCVNKDYPDQLSVHQPQGNK